MMEQTRSCFHICFLLPLFCSLPNTHKVVFAISLSREEKRCVTVSKYSDKKMFYLDCSSAVSLSNHKVYPFIRESVDIHKDCRRYESAGAKKSLSY